MFCKKVLALLFWCQTCHIVLYPLIQLLSSSSSVDLSNNQHTHQLKQDGQIFTSEINIYTAANFGPSKSLFLLAEGSPITVNANQVALTIGHEIILRCNIQEHPAAKFTWHRTRLLTNKERETSVEPKEESFSDNSMDKHLRDRYTVGDNFIIIKNPSIIDQGDYYCRLKDQLSDTETEKMIIVRIRPLILDFNLEHSTDKSAIVKEGKMLRLPCNVIDDYAPEANIKITWYMSKFDEEDMNTVVDGESGIRLNVYNSTSQELVIDSITSDHRKFYKCHVTNGIMDNSRVIFIRVKNDYGIIWPTVGIVIEVVILIGVIVVVENRKVEPDKGPYDRKAIQM